MAGTERVHHVSQHQAFRRVPVPQQVAQAHKTVTLPAPTRGLIQSENEAYMQPGAALVCRQLDADHARVATARRLRALG